MEKPTEHFDWAEDVVFDIDDLKKSSPAPTASQASVVNNSKADEITEPRYNRPSSSRYLRSPVVSRDQTKEQHELMKQKIEAARRRKEQELAEEEARKQERIRVLLEGLDLKQKQKADERAQQEREREQERQRQREVRRQALKQRQEQLKAELQAEKLQAEKLQAEKLQAEKLQEEKLKKQSRNSLQQCDQKINDTVPRAVLPPTGPAIHGPSLDSIQALQSKIQRKLSCSPDSSRHSISAESGVQESGPSWSQSKVPAGPKRTLMRRPASFPSQSLEFANKATIVQNYTTAGFSNDSFHLKPVVKLNLGLEGEFDTPVGSDTDEAIPRSAVIYSDFAQSSSKFEAASVTNPENDCDIVVDVPREGRHLGRY